MKIFSGCEDTMQKIKTLLYEKILPEYKQQFEQENYRLSLSRIRIICLTFVILSFYFVYADVVVYKSIENTAFKATLYIFHLVGFTACCLFLLLYRRMKTYFSIKSLKLITRGFIIALLLTGSLASINSQRLTGNIDAYIIFTVVAAISFPFEPVFMFFCFMINHIILMAGLLLLVKNNDWLITKQINSTALAALSFFLCYSLYRQRVVEFTNKHRLAERESNLKKLFSVNPIPLFISRFEDGQIIIANDRAYNFYGYTKEEFHKIFAKNLYKDENDRALMLAKLHSSDKLQNYIVEQKTKLGILKWVIANYETIEYDGQNCILTCVTDITEIKKMENELLDHASTDTLTSVLNRRIGMDMLKGKINLCKQNRSALVICFLDIDGLKSVNDKYGHNEGDFLISKTASIVRDNISTTDVLFRYGGDEFIILFTDTNKESAEEIWNKIKAELKKFNDENIKPYKLGASHGMFEYNGEDLTLEQILEMADKKMYDEKNNKRLADNILPEYTRR
jgi:diguanylate cyclase (GGDEF)-like protein/PAS domain S-box-containing protein